jgi:DHA1 family bicyclomycin/chloramphenicol resistance-like MFS transporter
MAILGGLQTIMPISTDLYLPALPTIARDLNVSAGAAQFTLAVFMLGVAIGQVVYGPVTDKYGRKKPLLVGLAVYILGALVCALAPTIDTMIGGRFLQALGASAGSVIAIAVARDLWSDKTLTDRLSLLFLVIGVAPILAPSLGGLILTRWDWHGLFWFLVAFGLLVTVTVCCCPKHPRPTNVPTPACETRREPTRRCCATRPSCCIS